MIFGYPSSDAGHNDVLAMEYLLGAVARPIRNQKDVDGIHLLVLYGGEDISTGWYNEKPVRANAPEAPRNREIFEAEMVGACLARGIPILGICRGAQFMCAYLGGKLWQHVDGHAAGREHTIIMDGKKYRTNSYHHQMMRPSPEMEVLAVSEHTLSPVKWSEVEEKEEDEAEIVYHRGKKVLMIQGHPEWVDEDHDLFKITHKLVKELLWK